MIIFRIFAILAVLAFGFGYLGIFHPLADSIAIGRPLCAIAIVLCAWSLRRPFNWALSSASVIWLVTFAISFFPSSHLTSVNFRLYQHNLLFTNTAPDLELVAKQLHPDVMTFQEVEASTLNIGRIEGYSYSKICRYEVIGKIAIISRLPFIDSGCANGGARGFAWARVQHQNKQITIVSLHLDWPFPYEQNKQIEALLPQLKKLPQPVILGGDFNQVPWSHSFNTIAKSINAEVNRKTHFTLVRTPIFLPIDHVMSPFPMRVEKLDRYGSDHHGLFAELRIE